MRTLLRRSRHTAVGPGGFVRPPAAGLLTLVTGSMLATAARRRPTG